MVKAQMMLAYAIFILFCFPVTLTGPLARFGKQIAWVLFSRPRLVAWVYKRINISYSCENTLANNMMAFFALMSSKGKYIWLGNFIVCASDTGYNGTNGKGSLKVRNTENSNPMSTAHCAVQRFMGWI